ncbi:MULTISPECIES: hypothetical protein [Ancylomarina]|uniref:Uncharacterized protein n=1 Tax=Ancylomarina euxinus TaxID=2283627 RepID=A0A425Y6Z5_9BACT|nr:hypothetical protein [Ancylomarina euxinus]MBI9035471.1 hypothetical protein [Bacteroidales bacterium]MCZ4693886.1 hypothetical protein [Ancylomarina euxinus]MUP14694.1 hypothetical protein [Ancylomarina euxinus]RRG24238.1 hypothetical protein DWB61_03740 [Ancylomarina euxinus]
MRLFEGIQKIIETGTRLRVSVPVSKSIILSNKTTGNILIYPDMSSKIGFPLKPKEDLEIDYIDKEATFHVELEADLIKDEEGFYIISQTDLTERTKEGQRVINTVVVNNQNTEKNG